VAGALMFWVRRGLLTFCAVGMLYNVMMRVWIAAALFAVGMICAAGWGAGD